MAKEDIVRAALNTAVEASDKVVGTTSPNPPVGAVILSPTGDILGVGATQPPGGPHAEVMALAEAGDRAQGGIAVVTLEPCNHYGRTGPCSHALLAAGISELYYVHADPTSEAAGGAAWLTQQGMKVQQLPGEVPTLRAWLLAQELRRPHVTLKFAQTLDGFSAACDGTSQWITGELARHHVHQDRCRRDAIVVGTGTARADNPSLTARTPDGGLYPHQPRRVVIGHRRLSAQDCPHLHRLGFEQYPDIPTALSQLWDTGVRDLLVEGGPTLATAFFRLGYVDAIQAYIAPKVLGDGLSTISEPLSSTLSGAHCFHRSGYQLLGEDILVELRKK
ncbi:bifunctional diaminohydroxyphosphoribosylaminopyrimidine deaminase/5-amino-6-(5-phosphoribosylamino)uracil reductase RibD [Corynebacterium poyangense]|uniref:Riboflavin biosynthesis protein RibD n=1 Tax=Corynebacterium poyangense TaxID=2684405 RepID=A0A7H0SP11_9CORY|nr:bifunctional diaminohydroxyphosphoribosylaminopyrimidine deaminase/5-amino-6-(5-phosphoribosylamino)uracil reductase RibD [Corynebacterium poyangense]QNQ90286.1 bifunctional diaminohydroxyphosphoribosylaminopyrimidine deaminase/5-amino-6-(5-phosphoribosylamino)uracil reductase RibD [Corynebacterium poyangense]